jgi:hypothetical protein
VAAVSLSACAGLPGTGGQNFDLNKFLTDPACSHDDEITGVTGAAGIPASLQFKASRHCTGVTHAPPLTTGQVVAPEAPPT